MKNKNIFFIGFMACGKSTLARALAKELDWVFLDSDSLIEAKFDKSIAEIFAEFGEDFFRKEEQKIADFFCGIKNACIATGGGFIQVSNLDKIGFCVYLRASFESLKNRLDLEEKQKRPLFYDENKAKTLYNMRLKSYEEKANLILDVENKNIQELVDELKKRIR
ncbi:MAG: shikimate kinase [Campylobacter sp.]|nr:shikimate kinase [Campylobacter sp.]